MCAIYAFKLPIWHKYVNLMQISCLTSVKYMLTNTSATGRHLQRCTSPRFCLALELDLLLRKDEIAQKNQTNPFFEHRTEELLIQPTKYLFHYIITERRIRRYTARCRRVLDCFFLSNLQIAWYQGEPPKIVNISSVRRPQFRGIENQTPRVIIPLLLPIVLRGTPFNSGSCCIYNRHSCVALFIW